MRNAIHSCSHLSKRDKPFGKPSGSNTPGPRLGFRPSSACRGSRDLPAIMLVLLWGFASASLKRLKKLYTKESYGNPINGLHGNMEVSAIAEK